jgi:hypothetical protein
MLMIKQMPTKVASIEDALYATELLDTILQENLLFETQFLAIVSYVFGLRPIQKKQVEGTKKFLED